MPSIPAAAPQQWRLISTPWQPSSRQWQHRKRATPASTPYLNALRSAGFHIENPYSEPISEANGMIATHPTSSSVATMHPTCHHHLNPSPVFSQQQWSPPHSGQRLRIPNTRLRLCPPAVHGKSRCTASFALQPAVFGSRYLRRKISSNWSSVLPVAATKAWYDPRLRWLHRCPGFAKIPVFSRAYQQARAIGFARNEQVILVHVFKFRN